MTTVVNPTTRLLPPNKVSQQTLTVNGRRYSAAPGTAIDVPNPDAAVLAANGWIRIGQSGVTANRPSGTGVQGGHNVVDVGTQFFDSSLGYLITFDGAVWRSPMTGGIV